MPDGRIFRATTLLTIAGLLSLVLVPVASAHPVKLSCGDEAAVDNWAEAYLDQFDPNDPSTWTSAIARVTYPIQCENIDCWNSSCDPGEEIFH